MYSAITSAIISSYVDPSDIKDLVDIFKDEDPIGELKKISGDRVDHLRWLLNLIINPSDALKKEAKQLLQEMGQDEQ